MGVLVWESSLKYKTYSSWVLSRNLWFTLGWAYAMPFIFLQSCIIAISIPPTKRNASASLADLWKLRRNHSIHLQPSAVSAIIAGKPCDYYQGLLADKSRKNGNPKLMLPIKGFALSVNLARKMPLLDWTEFCRSNIYKAECGRCLNLLALGGQDSNAYNCFPRALVAQTRATLSIGPLATEELPE